jgi:hypothetical protein
VNGRGEEEIGERERINGKGGEEKNRKEKEGEKGGVGNVVHSASKFWVAGGALGSYLAVTHRDRDMAL